MLCAREEWHGRPYVATCHSAARLSIGSLFSPGHSAMDKGSGADSITMPRQLPDHAKSENWSFRRLQNVQAHHSGVQIAPVLGDEVSLSSFDYEGRTAK